MAEAKFETAPWVLGDGEWEVEQPRATRTACTQWQHITDENGNVIALVVGASNDFSKLSALVEKHARLIAAAPDLYEALKGAIGALEFSRDYHKDLGNEEQAFCQDRLDAALSALAKAGGLQ